MRAVNRPVWGGSPPFGRAENALYLAHGKHHTPMKLFQFDSRPWNPDSIDYTWQFGIFGNRSLFWARFEKDEVWLTNGLGVSAWFLSASSLLIATVELRKVSLSVALFTEYFDGWDK